MSACSALSSAIYRGWVVHTRWRPVRHRLRYRMLSLLLDLDELPALSLDLALFSYNRFNLFSFFDRDHLFESSQSLRERVDRHLQHAGLALDGGAVRLLCMPRVFGAVFNPLSVYFCHGCDGALRAVLYEVHNTFGECHAYLIPATGSPDGVQRQTCPKHFYVSPFMDMDLQYRFRVKPPTDRAAVAIQVHDDNGLVLSAALSGERQTLTDLNLTRGLVRHPLMAAQVLGAIHWEALKLWRKGMRARPRPDFQENVTIVAGGTNPP